MTADTIYALSSGAPPAAIAVVRISGPGADAALERLAGRLTAPRRASLVELADEGELLDRALALRFPGPGSATGEDVVELHLHGGRSVAAAVLGALGRVPGLREAQPGEFTRRAFENGRIDLAEAEGLADLLAAETEAQRRAALAAAGGAVSRQIEAWQARLLGAAAGIEAALDFDDEDDVQRSGNDPRSGLSSLAREIGEWLGRPPAERLRDGVRVAIAGPPNAGKSSLINALAGREAAITSAQAGTTRDVIEVPLAIGGYPFVLSDTAGLREPGEDAIEAIGIERARRVMADADIVLWLGAPDAAPDAPRRFIVQSKIDVASRRTDADLAVSAITGEGLDRLAGRLVDAAREMLPRPGEAALNARQRAALAEAHVSIKEASDAQDLLIAAEALRQARGALDRITGRAGVEDMLDALFGRFCIGK